MARFNDLETERLICELKVRRHMWHPQDKLYKNHEFRAESWDVITRNVVDGYKFLSEKGKKRVVVQLKHYWKGLRDKKIKAIAFNKKAKPGEPLKRSPYNEQLEFLQSIYRTEIKSEVDRNIQSEPVVNTFANEEIETMFEEFKEEVQGDSDNTPEAWKEIKNNEVPKKHILNDPQESSLAFSKEDEDRLFLESLLPTLRQFDTDQKLIFRSRVLDIMIYVKNSQSALH